MFADTGTMFGLTGTMFAGGGTVLRKRGTMFTVAEHVRMQVGGSGELTKKYRDRMAHEEIG